MRAHVRGWVVPLLLAALFGVVARWIGGQGHNPGAAVRSLSAPWLALPFVVGAVQLTARRATTLGFVATYVALAGYGLMTFATGTHHATPAAPLAYLSHERYTFLASLLTGPLFGWFGWRWRSQRAITGALVTATAFCLEPMARRLAEKPIHFPNVALAEVAVGLALATAVLIQRARSV